jgi:centrosomal protein CEP164
MSQGVPNQSYHGLDEEGDEYEPTQDEIIEYAKFLGIDINTDQDLLWIAVEGLKAPVPEPWRAIQYPSASDVLYFMNMQTGLITHEHPLDKVYRERAQQEKKLKEQQKQLHL